MAESIVHMNYVREIGKYVNTMIPEENRTLVLIDLPESIKKPDRTIDDFVPDLYYKDNNIFIIGEAKTENDVDRKHSLEQYESFIKEASLFNGESYFVLCTSLYSYARIKNIIRKIKAQQNSSICIHVLNDFGALSIL